MDLKLKGKTLFIAAASRGLGFATAMAAAKEGAKVVIGSRDEDAIQAAAKKITKESGVTCIGLPLEMREYASIRRWIGEGTKAAGAVNGLLVNAGGPPPGGFSDFSDEDWQDAFELTLLSSIRLIREAVEHFASGGGGILTVTSSSIKEPIANLILSNVMRSGVASLVKSLSRELAPRKIRVNNIIPGYFDTDRLRKLDENAAEIEDIPVDAMRQKRQTQIPAGRYGEPEEFGAAAAFLLSPAASYVTGHSFTIDGGAMHTVW
ncbi:SDR family oxidoreductase [Sediminispirochaeta smaragdinae]|jgi:3-oxoacyl-[acyl-carrier protein] reductase|uniref:Short-chain dehydrogenase/reductase SDR n=1 Tax=Sediminispirochaeta smaragdinae (strain DSM 11293 / JCM 15392 / SEBR 4228) TaxID=573413 RepID=E1R964_SEDSS|nr:SDR family oxidoreductase [Sediminispirochaeta smaragdinae]ADK83033.1 short-chain dehydrogenase/reductase SDR [Sediminispirochaeta smaragdinae DSM 11293]